jgi:hypothetical protein
MVDGQYKLYAIEFMTTHKSPHLKRGPIRRCKDPDDRRWGMTGPDSWMAGVDPHIGTGNDWRARSQKAHTELYSVYHNTGWFGWWTRRYALAALKRLRELDDLGKFDSYDGYNKFTCAYRHSFRIVTVEVAQKTTPECSVIYQPPRRSRKRCQHCGNAA